MDSTHGVMKPVAAKGVVTTSALIGMIYCYPTETPLRITFLELVAFEALEYAVEHDNSRLIGTVVAVIKQQSMPTFRMASWWEAGRERACLTSIIRHAMAGSLPPRECYDACMWLGVYKTEWQPLLADALKRAPPSAIQPLSYITLWTIVNFD